jgi:hypothetical protein
MHHIRGHDLLLISQGESQMGSNEHHTIAGAALFGTMALSALNGGSVANAQQQTRSTAGADGKTIVVAQANQSDDPNLPGVFGPPDLQLIWSQVTHGYPQVSLNSPEEKSNHLAHYIGWNDQGSWIRSEETGKIFVWNLQKKTLTKVYDNEGQVPQETLASMHNFKDPRMLANYKPAPNVPQQSEGPKPLTPDTGRQAGYFGGAGKLPEAAMTTPGAMAGSGAAVEGGVLTFTRPDKSRATYKVVRPKVMQGNPQPPSVGITGTWIAIEDGGNGIMFNVQADNSVTGREMPAQVIQMLMQGGQR